jgi:hypothetical protein
MDDQEAAQQSMLTRDGSRHPAHLILLRSMKS